MQRSHGLVNSDLSPGEQRPVTYKDCMRSESSSKHRLDRRPAGAHRNSTCAEKMPKGKELLVAMGSVALFGGPVRVAG